MQRTAKKSTKIYNARAQLLFCSFNLLFSDVLVAVVVLGLLKLPNKNYKARLQPLSVSLNLLFSNVPVAVVVFLNSLTLSVFTITSQ